MAHNVWTHIHAVQEANRQYDNGKYPAMLIASSADKKVMRMYDRNFFRDIVDDIFATSDRGRAEELVEHYNKYWMSIVGTRGATGKKTVNSGTMFNALFEVEDDVPQSVVDDNCLDLSKLDKLEEIE
jgi:hypothetical protein